MNFIAETSVNDKRAENDSLRKTVVFISSWVKKKTKQEITESSKNLGSKFKN